MSSTKNVMTRPAGHDVFKQVCVYFLLFDTLMLSMALKPISTCSPVCAERRLMKSVPTVLSLPAMDIRCPLGYEYSTLIILPMRPRRYSVKLYGQSRRLSDALCSLFSSVLLLTMLLPLTALSKSKELVPMA